MTAPGPDFFIRVDEQIEYCENKARDNQRNYRRLKQISIACNILTTFTIALAFTVPESFKIWMGIFALILSTTVLATYQWEEFQNYGSHWEKFRLVAEQFKSEKFLFINNAGRYILHSDLENQKLFVETIEKILRETDCTYFTQLVNPGKKH